MHEQSPPTAPTGLQEAPTIFRLRRPEDLRGQDLRGADLTGIEGLLPEHLARADLTSAKLPPEIEKFAALGQAKEISAEARKVFIGLLAACVYSWLVIGTTTDVALILNTASSPLPIINTPIPIAGFYVVGAALLAAVFCYFHFYLQRLWRTLSTLPAIFPDGVALDDKSDPWLLTNLVRTDFELLRPTAPPLARLESLLSIVLAWWLVPLTLLALWARYLPAHYWLGTSWLVFLIFGTMVFGRHSYRLARATLRGERSSPADQSDADGGILARAWHELRRLRPDRLSAGVVTVIIIGSLSAFHDNPRDPHTWVAKGLNALNFIGIRTYANLREVDVAQRPEGWDGKDWSKVKRVDLRNRNLAFADATQTFLANADLRGANLTGAILQRAELQGADFLDEDGERRPAQLQGADLSSAQLQGADLPIAQLQGADLRFAQLQGADLRLAQLQGADLRFAQLQGADLRFAQLQGADLRFAQLQGADLWEAQLQGAVLRRAQLQGAVLRRAQLQGAVLSEAQLQGAVLRRAQLQGAVLSEAQLQGAVLRSAQLQGAVLSEAQLQGADLRGGGALASCGRG